LFTFDLLILLTNSKSETQRIFRINKFVIESLATLRDCSDKVCQRAGFPLGTQGAGGK